MQKKRERGKNARKLYNDSKKRDFATIIRWRWWWWCVLLVDAQQQIKWRKRAQQDDTTQEDPATGRGLGYCGWRDARAKHVSSQLVKCPGRDEPNTRDTVCNAIFQTGAVVDVVCALIVGLVLCATRYSVAKAIYSRLSCGHSGLSLAPIQIVPRVMVVDIGARQFNFRPTCDRLHYQDSAPKGTIRRGAFSE